MGEMPYSTAIKYAEYILAWLNPYCQSLKIAGSIRRGRPLCNDVDLVCIPKFQTGHDLFGEVTSTINLLWNYLDEYVANSGGRAMFLAGGSRDFASIQLPKCQLDVWIATAETWATRLLCRTGSKEHNIYLCQRAERMGMHWNPSEGLTRKSGEPIPCFNEAEIYRALGMKFIEPRNRERSYLAREPLDC